MKQSVLRAIPRFAGLVFLCAAINKLIYPAQAITALEALGVQQAWADLMVFGTIALELYLGLILLLHLDLKWGLGASMTLMFVFVLFMWYLSMQAKPPSCGCLGLTHLFNSAKHEALFGLLRNCVILWLLKLAYDHYFVAPTRAEAQAA